MIPLWAHHVLLCNLGYNGLPSGLNDRFCSCCWAGRLAHPWRHLNRFTVKMHHKINRLQLHIRQAPSYLGHIQACRLTAIG
jgi:hypothetical protein